MKRERLKHKDRKTVQAEARGKAPVTQLKTIDGDKPPKREMKIRQSALGLALQKPAKLEDAITLFRQTFPVAPVPHWVPNHEDVKIAMDNAIEPFYGYAGQFAFSGEEFWPGFPALAELTQRSEYRMITEIRAKEMTRKWIRLTYKGEEPDDERLDGINEELERFKVRDLFRKLAEHDGFYGGGQLFIDLGVANVASRS